MASVPSVSGSTVVSALKKHGFEVDRIKGSHHIMKHPDGRGTTVPVHKGKDVPKGTLGSILTGARKPRRSPGPGDVGPGVFNAWKPVWATGSR